MARYANHREYRSFLVGKNDEEKSARGQAADSRCKKSVLGNYTYALHIRPLLTATSIVGLQTSGRADSCESNTME